MRNGIYWLCGALLLGTACTDVVEGESIRIDVCEGACDFGTTLTFGHPVFEDVGAERVGTVTAGGKTIEFACDGTNAEDGEGFTCRPDGSVRFAGLAEGKPPSLEVSVVFPESNLGFDRSVSASYADTCEGDCVDGSALVQLEAQGPLPGVCAPTAEGCSIESCRAARETCGISPAWAPNYTHCEEATGEPVDDWSHCAEACAAQQAGGMYECAGLWADRCSFGEAAAMFEVRVACFSCEEEPTPAVAACRSACIDTRLGCDEACPADSMGACLDCSAGCADTMLDCFAACG
jgi:hypothetical protein